MVGWNMNRSILAVALAGLVLLAGCASGVPSDLDGTDAQTGGDAASSAQMGTVDFYVSDRPNDMDDFEHLNVTVTTVQFHLVEVDPVQVLNPLLLPFPEPSALAVYTLGDDEGPARLIERWTGGVLRDVMVLVLDASVRALEQRLPRLTPSLLESTWQAIQTHQVTDFLALLKHRKGWM